MSRTKPRDMEQLALEYRCEYCEAKPYRWCVTTRGKRPGMEYSAFLHGNRNGPLYDAYRMGYVEYEDFLLGCTEEQLQEHVTFIQRVQARQARQGAWAR